MNIDLVVMAKFIWCVFVVLWGGLRYQPNRKSRRIRIKKTKKTPREYFSMCAATLGFGCLPAIWVFTDYLAYFDYQPRFWLLITAILGLIASLCLFRLTHKNLGKMWSHTVDLRENHKLITHGIYEKVRHPMYTAFWIWAFSSALLIPNWLTGFGSIMGFGTLYILRVKKEEQMMQEEFGQEYVSYMQRTKRLIPNIY